MNRSADNVSDVPSNDVVPSEAVSFGVSLIHIQKLLVSGNIRDGGLDRVQEGGEFWRDRTRRLSGCVFRTSRYADR